MTVSDGRRPRTSQAGGSGRGGGGQGRPKRGSRTGDPSGRSRHRQKAGGQEARRTRNRCGGGGGQMRPAVRGVAKQQNARIAAPKLAHGQQSPSAHTRRRKKRSERTHKAREHTQPKGRHAHATTPRHTQGEEDPRGTHARTPTHAHEGEGHRGGPHTKHREPNKQPSQHTHNTTHAHARRRGRAGEGRDARIRRGSRRAGEGEETRKEANTRRRRGRPARAGRRAAGETAEVIEEVAAGWA